MKKLLTLLILAFCLNGWAQYLKIDNRQIVNKDLRLKTKHLYSGCYQKTQSNVSLLDSIKTWSWDTIANVWKPIERFTNYTYNTQNKNTSNLRQSFNGTNWVNVTLYSYSYAGNTEYQLQKKWDATNNVWVN